MTASRLRRLSRSAALLAALAAGGTLRAAEPAPPPERLVIAKTAAAGNDELDPTLRQWFKEQDKLLDQILVRLGRIENLVTELHRLIRELPIPTVAAPAVPPPPPAASAPPVKPAPPLPAAPPAPREREAAPNFGVLISGGMLAVLLILGLLRRRHPAPPQPAAATPAAVRAAPRIAPAASPAPPSEPPISEPEVPVISESQQEQAIELAEIMLSMGLGHGAAQTLLEQIRHEPKQALRQWLKLLEIYRRNEQQEEFQRSAEELRLYFNVRPQDWLADPDLQRSVEDYPHIAKRLTELWGTQPCLAYLKHLLDDNRGGARTGFPQAVAEEMLLLAGILRNRGIA